MLCVWFQILSSFYPTESNLYLNWQYYSNVSAADNSTTKVIQYHHQSYEKSKEGALKESAHLAE